LGFQFANILKGKVCELISPKLYHFSQLTVIGAGRLKMQDRKMTDRKMTDKSAGLENAGLENDGQKCRAGKCRTGK